MKLEAKVKAIREASKKSTMSVGGKEFEVHPDVVKLLEGEGIKYLDGEERTDKEGNTVYLTMIKTLKKEDAGFDKLFAEIYNTIAGEMLLKDGIDVEGVNPTLESVKE